MQSTSSFGISITSWAYSKLLWESLKHPASILSCKKHKQLTTISIFILVRLTVSLFHSSIPLCKISYTISLTHAHAVYRKMRSACLWTFPLIHICNTVSCSTGSPLKLNNGHLAGPYCLLSAEIPSTTIWHENFISCQQNTVILGLMQ